MEKKRLFKILSKFDRDEVIRLGTEIQNQYSVTVIKKPEKALSMIKMREPVKNSLFYLGEIIITEASVAIGDTIGTAATMGDDFDKTLYMAIIDAACNKGIFAHEKLLLEWEIQQNEMVEKENAMLRQTKVNFKSMDSEVTE